MSTEGEVGNFVDPTSSSGGTPEFPSANRSHRKWFILLGIVLAVALVLYVYSVPILIILGEVVPRYAPGTALPDQTEIDTFPTWSADEPGVIYLTATIEKRKSVPGIDAELIICVHCEKRLYRLDIKAQTIQFLGTLNIISNTSYYAMFSAGPGYADSQSIIVPVQQSPPRCLKLSHDGTQRESIFDAAPDLFGFIRPGAGGSYVVAERNAQTFLAYPTFADQREDVFLVDQQGKEAKVLAHNINTIVPVGKFTFLGDLSSGEYLSGLNPSYFRQYAVLDDTGAVVQQGSNMRIDDPQSSDIFNGQTFSLTDAQTKTAATVKSVPLQALIPGVPAGQGLALLDAGGGSSMSGITTTALSGAWGLGMPDVDVTITDSEDGSRSTYHVDGQMLARVPQPAFPSKQAQSGAYQPIPLVPSKLPPLYGAYGTSGPPTMRYENQAYGFGFHYPVKMTADGPATDSVSEEKINDAIYTRYIFRISVQSNASSLAFGIIEKNNTSESLQNYLRKNDFYLRNNTNPFVPTMVGDYPALVVDGIASPGDQRITYIERPNYILSIVDFDYDIAQRLKMVTPQSEYEKLQNASQLKIWQEASDEAQRIIQSLYFK